MSEIVITAGGTREKIDDVRYVGNFSSGRLGHAIAGIYSKWSGDNVTLLAPQSTIDRFGLPDGVKHELFMSARDLSEKLLGIKAANVVIHSAAVSDYTPIYHEGKIRSDAEELTITMKRNSKILSELREHFGDDATLVGFKLLSNVSTFDLEEAARQQIDACNLDFCVANDLSDVRSDYRKITLLRKAVGLTFMSMPIKHYGHFHEGTVESTANYIVDSIKYKHKFENRELLEGRNWP